MRELKNVRQEEMELIPWDDKRVTFILFLSAGGVWVEKTLNGKIEIIDNTQSGDSLLAAWTGKYSTDIFQLDIGWLKAEIKKWKRKDK